MNVSPLRNTSLLHTGLDMAVDLRSAYKELDALKLELGALQGSRPAPGDAPGPLSRARRLAREIHQGVRDATALVPSEVMRLNHRLAHLRQRVKAIDAKVARERGGADAMLRFGHPHRDKLEAAERGYELDRRELDTPSKMYNLYSLRIAAAREEIHELRVNVAHERQLRTPGSGPTVEELQRAPPKSLYERLLPPAGGSQRVALSAPADLLWYKAR
jgi:hypothetical protein